MRYKKYILIAILLLCFQPLLQAQQEADTLQCPRSRYCWYNLSWDNSWLKGANAAALVKNPHYNLSYFELGGDHTSGDFTNVFDPVSNNNLRITAASYQKLNKTYLYGRFGYGYNAMKDVQWYGLIDPYSTPFLMADSIPGNYNLEQFYLDGGIAHPLSKHWTLGAYVNYNVASGGKTKDLRNKNTYMHFAIRPSVLYRTGNISLGLNATYDRKTEKVDYKQFGDQGNLFLYFFDGMWYYNREVLGSSTPYARDKVDESYGGGLQFELNNGGFRFYNEFSALRTYQEQTKDLQAFGDVDQMAYTYTGVIDINSTHQINLAASYTLLYGYDVLQKKVWHDPSKMYQYATFATNKVYNRDITTGLVSYTFRKKNADKSLCFDATIGARGYMWNMDRTANLYVSEDWKYVEGFINIIKRWYLGTNQLEIRPGITYGKGDGTPKDITASSGSGGLSQEGAALMKEFSYMTATRAGGNLAVRYSYGIKPNGNIKIYGELSGGYTRALSTKLDGEHRSITQLTLGVSF